MHDSITYKVRVIMLDGPRAGETSDRKVVRSKSEESPSVGGYLLHFWIDEWGFSNEGSCRIDAVQRVPV